MSQSRVSVANANFQECNNEFFKSGCEQCGKRTNARYWIVVMLFIVTSFNYGDRATLSIAGSEMAKDIGLDPVGMGYVFSAFSWAYVIGQILVAGCWIVLVQNASTSGRSLSGRCLPCCKASSISLVDSALSWPCLHCASWSGLLKRHLSWQQPHCCGLVSGAGKGNGGVDF